MQNAKKTRHICMECRPEKKIGVFLKIYQEVPDRKGDGARAAADHGAYKYGAERDEKDGGIPHPFILSGDPKEFVLHFVQCIQHSFQRKMNLTFCTAGVKVNHNSVNNK